MEQCALSPARLPPLDGDESEREGEVSVCGRSDGADGRGRACEPLSELHWSARALEQHLSLV